MHYVVAFYVGACFGSFINVVIYRLKTGENFISGRSHCPVCEVDIALYDNMPIISYLILRGKCRHCHIPIPIRYLLAEITAGFFALTWYSILTGVVLWPGLTGLGISAAAFIWNEKH